MMSRQWNVPGLWESMVWNEDGEEEVMVLDFALSEDQAAAADVTLSERSYPRGVKRGVLRGVA